MPATRGGASTAPASKSAARVYSPCDLCKDDPTRAPVWQIRAERIVDDKELKIVEYHDAEMDIDGVPVMWIPYFTQPRSVGEARERVLAGGHRLQLECSASTPSIPYYWAIGPDKDMTFAPLITSEAGVVLIDQYRQRFANGMIDLQGSIAFGTPAVDVGTSGQFVTNDAAVRGHLFGTGEFDLDDDWRATFNIQRTSDITYLLRYGFPSAQDFLTS